MLFESDSELGIRQRIFQLMTLIAGLLATVVVVPIDLLEHLPLSLCAGVLLFGLTFLGMLYLARQRDIYLYKSFSFLVLLLLNFAWFLNCGSQGPESLIFFSAAILFTVLFEGVVRWMFLSVFVFDVVALYYVEHFFPKLVSVYASPVARLHDLTASAPASLLLCVLMTMTVLSAYDAKQRRLMQSKAELEAMMSEMHVLKGLLPICAACKKIRTEEGEWTQMEVYIQKHSHASFTHGLCPECMPIYLGEQD